MIEKLEKSSGKNLGFVVSGKLRDEDYKTLIPQVESVVEKEGKVRLLVQFHDFHGWDLHAVWDDFKFGVTHYNDLERFALVGERKWEEWMAKLSKPFTKAEVRYFDASEIEQAWKWLGEDS